MRRMVESERRAVCILLDRCKGIAWEDVENGDDDVLKAVPFAGTSQQP